MKLSLDILILLTCLLIGIQDIRSRLISVSLLASMGLFLLLEFFLYNNSEENGIILLCNYLFVAGQTLFLYFYFIHIRKINLSFFDQVIGWGDILMALCMALAFPLPQLVLYLLASYGLGIVFGLFLQNKTAVVSIPLAGMMALVYFANTTFFYCTGYNLIEPFAA